MLRMVKHCNQGSKTGWREKGERGSFKSKFKVFSEGEGTKEREIIRTRSSCYTGIRKHP